MVHDDTVILYFVLAAGPHGSRAPNLPEFVNVPPFPGADLGGFWHETCCRPLPAVTVTDPGLPYAHRNISSGSLSIPFLSPVQEQFFWGVLT